MKKKTMHSLTKMKPNVEAVKKNMRQPKENMIDFSACSVKKLSYEGCSKYIKIFATLAKQFLKRRKINKLA